MEYYKKCNICGKIFSFNDSDINENRKNISTRALSSIAGLASLADGSVYNAYEQNKISEKAVDKIKDFDQCPNCGSRDVRFLSFKEIQDIKDQLNSSQSAIINPNASVESLIKRGYLFLEDKNWKYAQDYFDNVLDIEPENSTAYLGKLLIDLRLSSVEDLLSYDKRIDDNPFFIKALRFDKTDLCQTISVTTKRNFLNSQYSLASKMLQSEDVLDVFKARNIFNELGDFNSSNKMFNECNEKLYIIANSYIDSGDKAKIDDAITILNIIHDYKDSSDIITSVENSIANKSQRTHKLRLSIVLGSLAIVVLFFTFTIVISPRLKYQKALNAYEEKDYITAYETFTQIKDYKDSDFYIYKIEPFYKKQVLLNSFKTKNIGDTVVFGSYKQNDIEWTVLDKTDDTILVITSRAIECRSFSQNEETWDNSSVRNWLDTSFYKQAFTEEEKNIIQSSSISISKNPKYETAQGNETKDRLFLLSIDEANAYFSSDESRICKAPAGTGYSSDVFKDVDNNCIWWLRSKGRDKSNTRIVLYSGQVDCEGISSILLGVGIRPAMVINFSE